MTEMMMTQKWDPQTFISNDDDTVISMVQYILSDHLMGRIIQACFEKISRYLWRWRKFSLSLGFRFVLFWIIFLAFPLLIMVVSQKMRFR